MISFRLPILALALALLLAAAPARAADAPPALTPAQTEAVNKLIGDYLMNNPQALIEALRHAESSARASAAASARSEIAAHADALEHDPASPVIGNPEGDVTIVEFFDYRCPYCKSTAPALQQLIERDKNVRLVLKEFPILGKDSQFAARVALVALRHGKYAAFHKAMFALPKVDEESTLGVAASLGLDAAAVRREMSSQEIDKTLAANAELAHQIEVDGTPAFVIGGSLVPGAAGLDQLREMVAAARNGKG
jgi:protein-disulfide isomerase